MKSLLPFAIAFALFCLPAFADSAASIPATPPSWATFIRGGLIAAGLFLVANLAGGLFIAWRQRRPPKG